MTLSKDAKKVLYRLYKEYLDRHNHGFSQSDSVKFGSSEEIRNSLFPELLFDDVDCFLRELRDNDFLEGLLADGMVYKCELSNYAIATMEALPFDALASIADFVLKFNLPIIGH